MKILKYFLGFFLLAGVLIASILMYGKHSGGEQIAGFLEQVEASSPKEFREIVHPALILEADPELIQNFFKAVLEESGSFREMQTNGMSFSDKLEGGVRHQEYQGVFRFEHRDIPMEINFADGKLLAFSIEDEELGENALERTHTISETLKARYVEKARGFWVAVMNGELESAFEMLHVKLRQQVGKEQFIAMFEPMLEEFGDFERIQFVSSRPHEKNNAKIVFFFTLDMSEKKGVPAEVIIELVGFKGHILGFQIPSKERP